MASANIRFDKIPSSINKPGFYVEFNTKLAVRTLPANLRELILVGQRTADGSVVANEPVRVYSDAQAAEYFGQGSMLHLMARAAIRANRYLQLSAIALDDAGAGVASTRTITLVNDAASVGVSSIYIGSEKVEIAVSSGDTAAVQAAALVVQFNSQADLPFVASSNAGDITLTAKNKGVQANGIKVTAETTVVGTTITVVNNNEGDVDPDADGAYARIAAAGHEIICCAYNDQDGLTDLRTHIENVSGPIEQRGAVGVYGFTGTLSAATTLSSQINNGRITGFHVPNAYDSSFEIAAAYAAVIAFEEDPARPLNGLALTGILPNDIADRLTRNEQETELANGVSPSEIGPGEQLQIVRAITTYTKNSLGIDDISLMDLTTIQTLDYVRKAVRERMALRFPREKLTGRIKSKVRSEIIDVLYKLEELEIIERVADNVPGIIVEVDLQNPSRLNVRIPADVVNGLHIFASVIDLLL